MVFMPDMAEFMQHHIFDEIDRRHDEPKIKIQVIPVAATPPASPDILQPERWQFHSEGNGEFPNFFPDYQGSLFTVPVLHQFSGVLCLIRAG
jgi:hypothetical protein